MTTSRRCSLWRWLLNGIAVVLIFSWCMAKSANADDYRVSVDEGTRLVSPADRSVCKLWGRNLSHWARKNTPLQCDRPIDPSIRMISRPEWQELDAMEHIDLLFKLDESMSYNDYGKKAEFENGTWRKRLEDHVREGLLGLSVTQIDLRGNGSMERVLKYQHKKCASSLPRVVSFFVVDESMSKFVQIKGSLYGGDLFVYMGKVYSEWVGLSGSAHVSRVVTNPTYAFVSICEYEHITQ